MNSYKYNNHNYNYKFNKDFISIYEDNKLMLCYDLEEFDKEFKNDFEELIEFLVDDNYANYYETLYFIYKNDLIEEGLYERDN